MRDDPIPHQALVVPPDALVLLVGAAGSGKSTLVARLFSAAQVLSSDAYRTTVSGDATDQSATTQAFRRLHATLERRMAAGELTVIDATNVQA
ncbi:MAG: AAA family ATPase, partial [Candidatus Limnocylindria bacterium]